MNRALWMGMAVAALAGPASADLVVGYTHGGGVVRYSDDGTPLATLSHPDLGTPGGLTTGPDGLLYVAGAGSSNIVRFNPATNAYVDEFVTTASGGLNAPNGLAFGGDGNLYVADFPNNNVLRYNGQTGAFIDVFAPAFTNGMELPIGITTRADGDLYITNYDRDVLRYDPITGFVDAFVEGSGSSRYWYLAFSPTDGDLYAAALWNDEVLRFDGDTGDLVGAVVVDSPTGLAFAPDGRLFVTSHEANLIATVDTTTMSVVDSFNVSVGIDEAGPTGIVYVVPEPTTLALAVGAACLLSRRRV